MESNKDKIDWKYDLDTSNIKKNPNYGRKKNKDEIDWEYDLDTSNIKKSNSYKKVENSNYTYNKNITYKPKKKIKIKAIILIVLFLIVVGGIAVGVMKISKSIEENAKPIEVNNIEELIAAKGKDIELMADLDFMFQTISPINCKNFNGNGHTIKNVIISNDSIRGTTSLFSSADSINDLYLDNISVSATSSFGAAILCQISCRNINNVHIKNSKVTTSMPTYGSGLGKSDRSVYVGGIYSGSYLGEHKEEVSSICNISNCSVVDSTLEIVKEEETSIYYTKLVIGGIAGTASNINNCYTSGLNIICTSSGIYNDPIVGGVVGYLDGKLENSYAINNKINVKANYYSNNILNRASTSEATCGGLVGSVLEGSNIKYCYTNANQIDVSCSGDIYVGGLVGTSNGSTIDNSYTYNNKMVMLGFFEENEEKVSRTLGGFIGSTKNDLISSSFSYNETKLVESNNTKEKDSTIGGFAGLIDNSTILNVASYMNNASGINIDSFSNSVGECENCYINNYNYGNMNSCEIIDDSYFINANWMENNLNLIGLNWNFVSGKLPYLNFNND